MVCPDRESVEYGDVGLIVVVLTKPVGFIPRFLAH